MQIPSLPRPVVFGGQYATRNLALSALTLMATFLAVSPAFCTGQAIQPASAWDIYAGGGTYVGTHPSVSPDASSVVYSSPATGHGDIYRFDRRTGRGGSRHTEDRRLRARVGVGSGKLGGGAGHYSYGIQHYESRNGYVLAREGFWLRHDDQYRGPALRRCAAKIGCRALQEVWCEVRKV